MSETGSGLAIVDRLVTHITGAAFEDLGPEVLDKAAVFLLDSLGVGIAGSSGASVDALIATVSGWGAGDEATIWVSGERLPAGSAAVVNAYQIHCLEYDCVHEGAVVHPMATVLSALMAYAERRSAAGRPVSGRDFLLALCIGVDVATLLGVAATGPVRFFRPATAGGFGATSAIARLEGLDAAGVKDALGAVYAQTSGTLQPHVEGSPMLGLQIGFNARAALAAVDLARAGLRGPHDMIDGPYGYLRLIEDDAFDLSLIEPLIGHDWQIARLAHKPFPSGRLTHGVVDALMQLSARHGFAPAELVRLRGRVPPLVMRLVGRPDIPDPSPNYAKLCLRYVAGAWLARGQVDVPEFRDPDILRDPAVHDFAARVEIALDDNPDVNALDPQWFEVELASGARHEIWLEHVFGHPEAPLSTQQNLDKFRRCIGYARTPMAPDQAASIEDAVAGLTGLDDAAKLARLTVIGRSGPA
ncbi:MAG: MmgE/PrpD family protein [Pseudomonadota bacterium]